VFVVSVVTSRAVVDVLQPIADGLEDAFYGCADFV
jgi:hypothetical protein